MSTLSIDTAVSLFEPSARAVPAPTAAPVRSPRPARRSPSSPASHASSHPESLPRHGRRVSRPQAAHARRSAVRSVAGLGAAVQLVALRALGTSAAAAVVTWALAAKGSGNAGDVAVLSLRGLAAAGVICAAWGFQDRARLGALGATRTWYATAILLAVAHTAWFTTTTPGRAQDHLGLLTAVFVLDVVLVVVPALLGARAGRPEGATA
jgi:hypothetical protein